MNIALFQILLLTMAGGLVAWKGLSLLSGGFGFALVTLAACGGIPAWREAIGKGLTYLSVKCGEKLHISLGRTDQSGPGQLEKPPPEPEAGVAKRLSEIHEKLDRTNILRDVADGCEDLEVLWRMAVNAIEDGDLSLARSVIDVLLEKDPESPKGLIASGYLWRKEGDLDRAIQHTSQALSVTEEVEEEQERFLVANANLCFYFALRNERWDKVRALKHGKVAADNVDTFENRDSFLINYGFAQVRFAGNLEELLAGTEALIASLRRELDSTEREEVSRYISEAAEALKAFS